MLTNQAVKAARPRDRAYKLADAGGLYLFVAPTGTKSFRMKFRHGGREQLLTFGEISLADARARADAAREQLGRGEDPRVAPPALTFEAVARRWHAHNAPRWSAVHAADVLTSLDRHVFPAIGGMPIAGITAPVVLNALRSVEQLGRLETTRRVRQRVSAVFAFAMSEGTATHDPAAIVARALRPVQGQRRHPALLQIEDARALLDAAACVGAAPAIELASRFLALTAVRLAAVRGMTWGEIEGLDLASEDNCTACKDLPIWRIPAARMKLAAAKKRDAAHDHLVPLSAAAVDVLRQARAIAGARTGLDDLVFAGRGGAAPIGEAAIGALYARAGFAGRHVPHGWRATFSTVMNDRRPSDRAAIDRVLAHTPKDKVEAAYNRSEQLTLRRELLQEWADLVVGHSAD